MSTRPLSLGLASLLAGPVAFAAPPTADLTVRIDAPVGAYVYDTSEYDIVVTNTGNQTASTVKLIVQLPKTHTSPQVYVLGTLGWVDSRCQSLSGQRLECQLGSLKKNAQTTVSFDIALPQSSAPIVLSATASTTSAETNQGNNTDSDTAAQLHETVTVLGGDLGINNHCTGTGLTSFFECELFPSSLSTHDSVFEAGGAISFPDEPDYGGTWTQPAGDRLRFTYTYGGDPVATFDGWAVSDSCFEGLTTFPDSTYVSPYQVCLQ